MATYINTVVWNAPPVRKGDTTENIAFSIQDPAFPAGLVGATVKIWLEKDGSVKPVKEFTLDNGGVEITNEAEGEFNWLPYVPQIPACQYKYFVQIIYPGDIKKTRYTGTYTVVD